MSIPLVDLAAQHAEVADEVEAGLAEVFATPAFIGGKAVDQFERAYAESPTSPTASVWPTARTRLELALRGVGVRPGGEVILPANTFIATAEAVSRIGAIPVLVDVDPEYLLIDPEKVAATHPADPGDRAGPPVRTGRAGRVDQRNRRIITLPVVEDAAQSQGATPASVASPGVSVTPPAPASIPARISELPAMPVPSPPTIPRSPSGCG